MKRILGIFLSLMVIAGCKAEPERSVLGGKSYVMTEQQTGTEIILNFSSKEDNYNGKVVNRYFGSYSTDGNKISFGDAGATMMMGPMEAMEVERQYLQTLPQIRTYEIKDNKLLLKTQNGTVLEFVEQP